MKAAAARSAADTRTCTIPRMRQGWTPEGSACRILLALALLVYLYVLLRTAWICDDAYITFRTIENFLAGYGLTWNTGERVQAYTHPLWMFLLAGVRAITGEIYYSSLFASIALSLAAFLLLTLKVARTWSQALLAGAIVTCSKAFVDFSTSGLENPLSYLLVAGFLWLYLGSEDGRGQGTGYREQPATTGARDERPEVDTPAHTAGVAPGRHLKAPASTDPEPGCHGPVDAALSPRTRAMPCGRGFRLLQLSLLASLILLNRMDLALLIGPALLHAFWQSRSRRAMGTILLGLLPFLAWEVFSVIYYGFPFPNTAYAKIGIGIPADQLAWQGLLYLCNSLRTDPVTLPVITIAVVAAIGNGERPHFFLVGGVLLHLLYVVTIGGDFMSGRFLAVPLLTTAGLLASLQWPRRHLVPVTVAACAAVLLLSLCGPRPPWLSGSRYGTNPTGTNGHGIIDERGYYYQATGLLRGSARPHAPDATVREMAAIGQTQPAPLFGTQYIGARGYYARPEEHIIDAFALPDPLLARLPALQDRPWRIGHFERFVPDGYVEGLRSGRNELTDLRLRRFYDQLRHITTGPLFTRDRWKAILDLNLGRCRHLIDTEYYRHPPARLPMSLYTRPDAPRTADLNLRLPSVGAWVLLGQTCHATRLEITLDRPRNCRVLCPQGPGEPVEQPVPADPSGSPARIVRIPEPVSRTGFDRLLILPAPGDDACYVATIRILDAAM